MSIAIGVQQRLMAAMQEAKTFTMGPRVPIIGTQNNLCALPDHFDFIKAMLQEHLRHSFEIHELNNLLDIVFPHVLATVRLGFCIGHLWL